MLFGRTLLSLGLLLAPLSNASPLSQTDGIDVRSVEDGGASFAESSILKRSDPAGDYKCPATNNGALPDGTKRDYKELKYTKSQVTAALRAATNKQKSKGENWKPGRDYPHTFGNNEKLPFPCGANKFEFPLNTNGQTWNGEDTKVLPDRIVYEAAWAKAKKGKKPTLNYKFCGVMRHGPTPDFLNCPKA